MKKVIIDNPFVVSGYVSPDYFCDRIEESETLTRNLTNGNNVTLFSPRRMGKTGLIHHVFNKLKVRDPDILTVYVDLMPTESLSDFAGVFSSALINELDSSPKSLFKKALSVLSRLRPTISFDPVSGESKFSVDIAKGEEQATVEQLLSFVGSCGKQFYIAFDEFQQIALYPEKNVEALLRSKIQLISNAHFIFSGSNLHMLSEMFISAKRPFYASTAIQNIGSIPCDPYYQFSSSFFEDKGRNLPEEVFRFLYDRFDGHTWYIQKVLNKIYSWQIEEVDEKSVLKAIKDIISENEYYYQMMLRAYSRGQGRLMKAIAREGCIVEIFAGEFISKYSLNATSSVRSAVKRLVDDELVYHDAKGYSIYDRFMAEWLKTQMI